MSSIDDLKKALNTFNVDFPRPNLKLEISTAYDIRENFSLSYPNASFPSVYVISKPNEEILRIGKASCNSTLGSRLSTYYRWHKTDYVAVPVHEGYDEAFIIHTIKVPSDRAFEAPAIEEYLLSCLKPPYNKNGT